MQQPARAAGVVSSLHIIDRVNAFLLGGLTPREFLRRHWQKRPLFVRGALPRFSGVLSEPELRALAARDDVEARVVERRGPRDRTQHGPFARLRPQRRDWTLLVSGVNLHHVGADALLRRFSFVPQARLDDVMVSYATPGGGVGPHVDSYDVFLLQGSGRRRWRISSKGGREFDPGSPLPVLSGFVPDEEWVLGPGDMLYLPPGWAHEGTAVDACLTCSVG